jgi:hypothetical protein
MDLRRGQERHTKEIGQALRFPGHVGEVVVVGDEHVPLLLLWGGGFGLMGAWLLGPAKSRPGSFNVAVKPHQNAVFELGCHFRAWELLPTGHHRGVNLAISCSRTTLLDRFTKIIG